MSNEVLIAIVAITALVTLSLWRMMATKASRPAGLNKKAAKALWHSDPIVPRHDPPKIVGGKFPSLADEADRVFFGDFKEFADGRGSRTTCHRLKGGIALATSLLRRAWSFS